MPSYGLYSFVGTVKELSQQLTRASLLAASTRSKADMRIRFQLGWQRCRLKNKLFGLLYSPFNLLTKNI